MKAFVKDNRGVTLVELLIATVIFALITIPLLNSFKVATMTAAKSQQMGRVTVAAQNLVERATAADVKTLVSGTAGDAATAAKNVFKAGEALYYRKNASNVFETIGNGADINAGDCIWLEDVSSGDGKYNAMVEIRPDSAINSVGLSDYRSIKPMTAENTFVIDRPADGSGQEIALAVTKKSETEVELEISTKAGTGNKTEDEAKSDETGQGGNAEGVQPETIAEEAGGATGIERIVPADGFSCVYLLYTPVYNNGITEDVIKIENNSNLDFDVFLVKRNPGGSFEVSYYRCTINQTGSPVKIYTNVADMPTETGTRAITANIDLENSFIAKKAQERAYNVTVKIYPSTVEEPDDGVEPLYVSKSMFLD